MSIKYNLPSNEKIKYLVECWDEIKDKFNNTVGIRGDIREEVHLAVTSFLTPSGYLEEDAVGILTEALAPYDVHRQTIEKYYQENNLSGKTRTYDQHDLEEFIETLEIIIMSKINALLPPEIQLR